MKPLPSLFVSHGSPNLALQPEDPFWAALSGFAGRIPKPKAVVCVSAHGTEPEGLAEVSANARPQTIHDFRGFPADLYQLQYPCAGDPDLAAQVAQLLSSGGFTAALTARLGLDHGVWVPMMGLYPHADVPVVQVTLPYPADPRHVLKLGRTLAPLRKEGVLLLGSGGAVHNLRELEWSDKRGAPHPKAKAFADWLRERLVKKDVESVVQFETEGPDASFAHPTTEHFYPLLFTVGAALEGDMLQPVYDAYEYRTLSMLSFALDQP